MQKSVSLLVELEEAVDPDIAVQLLDRMWDADLGVPRRVRALQDEGGTARQLRSFVDTFVTEDFLPDIYVDFRCGPGCCVVL